MAEDYDWEHQTKVHANSSQKAQSEFLKPEKKKKRKSKRAKGEKRHKDALDELHDAQDDPILIDEPPADQPNAPSQTFDDEPKTDHELPADQPNAPPQTLDDEPKTEDFPLPDELHDAQGEPFEELNDALDELHDAQGEPFEELNDALDELHDAHGEPLEGQKDALEELQDAQDEPILYDDHPEDKPIVDDEHPADQPNAPFQTLDDEPKTDHEHPADQPNAPPPPDEPKTNTVPPPPEISGYDAEELKREIKVLEQPKDPGNINPPEQGAFGAIPAPNMLPFPPPPPPPPPPPQEQLSMDDVEEYKIEDLEREIERIERTNPEKTNEQILEEIKEERKHLEEERADLEKEKEEKKENEEKEEKKKRRKKDEEEPEKEIPKTEVKSFAKERRKRKELERMQTYLFGGEWALLFVFVLAQLYSEGISADPLWVPFENTLYILIIFFLLIKIEKFFFRYLNMKYSGTVHRKAIGVNLFKGLEWPIVTGWAFVVAIFIIPPTHDFLVLLVDIFTQNGAIYQPTEGFLLKLTLLFLAHCIAGIVWIVYLTWYRNKVLAPELKALEEPFKIEEAFLITNSGLLIKRVSRKANSDMDDDILSSMLTAVKEFVKDSFGSQNEEGELDELQYGNMRIIIEYGKDLYMAVLVKGQESKALRPTMKKILRLIHRKYTRAFDTWDGDLARFKGCEPLLNTLLRLG